MNERQDVLAFMQKTIDGLLGREKSDHPIKIRFNAFNISEITPEIRKKLHEMCKEKGFAGAIIESVSEKPVVHLLTNSKNPVKLIPHTVNIGIE